MTTLNSVLEAQTPQVFIVPEEYLAHTLQIVDQEGLYLKALCF